MAVLLLVLVLYYREITNNIYMENLHSTRDLGEASALVSLKIPLLNIDYQVEGSHVIGYFVFERTPILESLVQKFRSGEMMVEPRAFILNLRSLKSQVSNVVVNPNTNINKLVADSDRRKAG